MEYDQSGKIISRTWADGKMWSYTYLEKVNIWGETNSKFLNENTESDPFIYFSEDLQEKCLFQLFCWS